MSVFHSRRSQQLRHKSTACSSTTMGLSGAASHSIRSSDRAGASKLIDFGVFDVPNILVWSRGPNDSTAEKEWNPVR